MIPWLFLIGVFLAALAVSFIFLIVTSSRQQLADDDSAIIILGFSVYAAVTITCIVGGYIL